MTPLEALRRAPVTPTPEETAFAEASRAELLPMTDYGIQELQELTGSTAMDREHLVAYYRALYTSGWDYSRRHGGSPDKTGVHPDAWHHGHADHDMGLPKWSTPVGDMALF
jgi:hypothetical protein